LPENLEIKPIKFRTHLILSFVTVTTWIPIYNLICFIKLNQLAKHPTPEGVPRPKNSPVLYFLLLLTCIGAPIAFYQRYKLLNEYISGFGPSRAPPAKKRDKETIDESVRLNCIAPLKFVGFAITAFLLWGIAATGFGLVFHHLFVNPPWTSDALMILFPIAFAATVTGLAFTVRTAKEEAYWVKAFNNIITEKKS